MSGILAAPCITSEKLYILQSSYLLKTPSIPETPIPSIISLVRRNGTVSGVTRVRPCSNAIPKKTFYNLIFKYSLSKKHDCTELCKAHLHHYFMILITTSIFLWTAFGEVYCRFYHCTALHYSTSLSLYSYSLIQVKIVCKY